MRSLIEVHFIKDSGEVHPKTYEYYADGSPDELSVFTHGVVMGVNNVLCLVEVTGVREMVEQSFLGEIKPVVALFNKNWFTNELEKKNKLRNLEAQAEEAMRKRSRLKVLEELAESDPDFQPLLAEYRRLMK